MASRMPHVAGSATSADAAEAMEPRAGTMRARVLAAIRAAGWRGMTDEELIASTGLNPSTARPRRVELADAGIIVPSGTRAVRSGLQAVVWVDAILVRGQQLRLGGVR